MDVTVNFGTCALRSDLFGVYVWDGNFWIPWEAGTPEEQKQVKELVMASSLSRVMPDKMRKVVLGT